MVTDLQALASTAAGFFPDHQQPLQSNMHMQYGQSGQSGHNGNGNSGYYAPTQPQPAYSYGTVQYAGNHGGEMGNQASLDSLKSGLQTIRDLFPETRSGAFDPRSYAQVENRLAQIQQYQLPFLSNPMAVAQPLSSGGGPQVQSPMAQYALAPLDNLRTKNDLLNLDQVVSTMQSTIYDSANQIAAAGVGQPGAHYVQGGLGYRSSHSPPSVRLPSSHNLAATTPSSNSNHDKTPSLTPPSSAVSNTSGNSPPSLHSHGMSPTTPGAMYPTLPGPNAGSASGGYLPSSMAPTSTLGNQFDQDNRRRYSGGRLQKAQPLRPKVEDAMDISEDGVSTPKNAEDSSSSETGTITRPHTRRNVNFSNSNLDPALGGEASPSSGELSEGAIKANEMWVGNARTIEALRTWINQRLEQHDYESDGEEVGEDQVKEEDFRLYPTLATE